MAQRAFVAPPGGDGHPKTGAVGLAPAVHPRGVDLDSDGGSLPPKKRLRGAAAAGRSPPPAQTTAGAPAVAVGASSFEPTVQANIAGRPIHATHAIDAAGEAARGGEVVRRALERSAMITPPSPICGVPTCSSSSSVASSSTLSGAPPRRRRLRPLRASSPTLKFVDPRGERYGTRARARARVLGAGCAEAR